MDVQDHTFVKPMAAWRDVWLPALLGLTIFVGFTGGSILSPHHIDWILNQADPTQHYMGWMFFRHQPLLQFPLGKNSAFGEVLGNSIVFSDSIPLMAFVFKLFSPWLAVDFQYFGIWILLCFVLQAVFAWKILALFTTDRWLIAIGSCFFVLSPAMLFRFIGHEALIGHWMVLAAIYLFLRPGPKAGRWTVLICMAVLVHAYLAAMVGALWFTDLMRRTAFRRSGLKQAAAEVLLVVGSAVLAAWVTGYFYPGSVREGGYGYFRFNLAGFFNPLFMFSAFGTGAIYSPGEYEGFAYLGAGVMGLAVLAGIGLFWPARRKLQPTWFTLLPIVLSSLLFLAYAVSNKIAWQGHELFSYEVPKFAESLTYVFRSSGRFVWPVLYWLQIGVFALVFAWIPGRVARVALLLLLALQVFDLSAGSLYFRDRWSEPYVNSLPSSFWPQVQTRYHRIAFVPVVRKPNGGTTLGLLAARGGMSVNTGYLARVDGDMLDMVDKETQAELTQRHWRPDTLYVVDNDSLWAGVQAQRSPGDLVANVDGFRILAPAWCQDRTGCDVAKAASALADQRADVTDFHVGGNAPSRMSGGWSHAEVPGTWTEGKLARLRLPVPAEGPLLITFEYDQLASLDRHGHHVTIRVNGRELGAWSSYSPKHMVREVRVPADVAAAGNGFLNIDIAVPDATSPQSIGFSGDERQLALFMQRVEVRKANAAAR